MARRRLRRRRHRHHGDQDRAGGLRARRRLHLHRDHHQYRRLPVQRPGAVHRQHVHGLAVRRAVWPTDHVDRPRARLCAAPGRDRLLMRCNPHAGARRVGSLCHYRADAAGGCVPRLLDPKLLRGLCRGRGASRPAACPRRRCQPDHQLRLGAGRSASPAEQSQNGQAGAEQRRLLQGWTPSSAATTRSRSSMTVRRRTLVPSPSTTRSRQRQPLPPSRRAGAACLDRH